MTIVDSLTMALLWFPVVGQGDSGTDFTMHAFGL